MKLIIFAISFFSLLPLSANTTSSYLEANTSWSQRNNDYKDLPKVDVYKLVQVAGNKWSTTYKTGYYDSSSNRMWVDGVDYNIYENPAYGQENDGRGSYKYRAGDYYFNL